MATVEPRDPKVPPLAAGEGAGRDRVGARLVVSPGPLQASESLLPRPGPASAPADRVAEYRHLGDLSLRFVFAGSGGEAAAVMRVSDLARLDLTPARALALASVQLKRALPPAEIVAASAGVHAVRSKSRHELAGRFLDRAFWRAQLARSPAGVWVAMPREGVLFFAYAVDPGATEELARLASRSFHSSPAGRLSAHVYRFDATGWHLQQPLPPAPALSAPVLSTPLAPAEDDDELLALAASGQKTVIYSILLNVLMSAVVRAQALPALVVLALSVAIAVFALFGVVRMCSGLQRSQNFKIACMVVTFVPLLNVVALVALSMTATRALRRAGWTVGLLGAKA